ncbi:MAG: L-serine ammonia-lyase, iron-sulfur-dependent, subunit alpha [Lactobacillales bacterium]|jgi:L-serine dehydratase|nr:L-serine ammonia-lyase, iron-sulfur-dependent, subunit alpha [Lactobacillales bacterium]
MFHSIRELAAQTQNHKSIADLMVEVEHENTDKPHDLIREQMLTNLRVMKTSIAQGIEGVTSVTGLTGGGGKLLNEYLEAGKSLSGEIIIRAMRNAIAVNEVNAKMGVICSAPTAGSAGVVPGVLMAVRHKLELSEKDQVDFLFTAGAFGLVIANNASISGAEGGCQAEIGSAAAIASGALVIASGGTVEQAGEAIAMTLKNCMGLICDPVAGLVEVPCVKRNAMGVSLAITSADLALAGIKSVIPVDEVIISMGRVGQRMPVMYKETADGGMAKTPTGEKLAKKILGK